MLNLQSANAGYGDRADPSQWSEIEGPVKVHHANFPNWIFFISFILREREIHLYFGWYVVMYLNLLVRDSHELCCKHNYASTRYLSATNGSEHDMDMEYVALLLPYDCLSLHSDNSKFAQN